MKFSTKATLTASSVTVIALGVSFLAALLLVIHQETADLDRALLKQALAEAEVARLQNPSHPQVVEGEVDIPEQLGPAARYAAIYDAEGHVLSCTSNIRDWIDALGPSRLQSSLKARSALNISVNGAALRAAVVPLDASGRRLLFAASRHEVDDDARFLTKVLGSLMLIMTALTSFAARLFGAHLARDIGELQRLAAVVATGDLTARAGNDIHGSSETRQLAKNLDHMIEKISELMTAQMSFVSHAAHELRSPLTTLRGELQLALHRPRTTGEYTEMIDQALSDVESLITLSEDLLVLARIQAAARPVHHSCLEEILNEAVYANRGLAARKSVQIAQEFADGVLPSERVIGSSSELARAVRNILDNAVSHSPISSTVRIIVSRTPEYMEIAVSDQGPGVPSGDPEQIFTPFFRGSTARASVELGAGLGLSIARAICRNAGGDVLLDTQHRPGARFVVRLRSANDGDTALNA